MKKTLKKFVALVAVLAMVITAVPVWAAYDSASSTWVADSIAGYLPAKNKNEPLNLATTRAKKISVKLANPKIGKITTEDAGFMKIFRFVPKSAGKSVITTKVGKKTFKTKVTVYNYTNPISSIKIGNTVISGNKFAKTDKIYLSYDKYAGKEINIKFNTKKGWYTGMITLTDKKGNTLPYNILQEEDDGVFNGMKVYGGKGNYIANIMFENSKNKGSETLSIVFR